MAVLQGEHSARGGMAYSCLTIMGTPLQTITGSPRRALLTQHDAHSKWAGGQLGPAKAPTNERTNGRAGWHLPDSKESVASSAHTDTDQSSCRRPSGACVHAACCSTNMGLHPRNNQRLRSSAAPPTERPVWFLFFLGFPCFWFCFFSPFSFFLELGMDQVLAGSGLVWHGISIRAIHRTAPRCLRPSILWTAGTKSRAEQSRPCPWELAGCSLFQFQFCIYRASSICSYRRDMVMMIICIGVVRMRMMRTCAAAAAADPPIAPISHTCVRRCRRIPTFPEDDY